MDDLETTDKFKLAVVQNKLLGPVIYRQPKTVFAYMISQSKAISMIRVRRDRDGKDPEVLKIYGQVSLLIASVIQSKYQSTKNRRERTLDAALLSLTSKSLGR